MTPVKHLAVPGRPMQTAYCGAHAPELCGTCYERIWAEERQFNTAFSEVVKALAACMCLLIAAGHVAAQRTRSLPVELRTCRSNTVLCEAMQPWPCSCEASGEGGLVTWALSARRKLLVTACKHGMSLHGLHADVWQLQMKPLDPTAHAIPAAAEYTAGPHCSHHTTLASSQLRAQALHPQAAPRCSAQNPAQKHDHPRPVSNSSECSQQ